MLLATSCASLLTKNCCRLLMRRVLYVHVCIGALLHTVFVLSCIMEYLCKKCPDTLYFLTCMCLHRRILCRHSLCETFVKNALKPYTSSRACVCTGASCVTPTMMTRETDPYLHTFTSLSFYCQCLCLHFQLITPITSGQTCTQCSSCYLD